MLLCPMCQAIAHQISWLWWPAKVLHILSYGHNMVWIWCQPVPVLVTVVLHMVDGYKVCSLYLVLPQLGVAQLWIKRCGFLPYNGLALEPADQLTAQPTAKTKLGNELQFTLLHKAIA